MEMLRINNSRSFEDLRTNKDFDKTQLAQLNHNMTMAVLPVTIFIGFECVVGLVGNILILLVYSLRYEKSNFRYFVLSMAVVDLTSCLTTLPGEIFSQMNWYTYEHGWICKVKSYFNVLTAWASASILFGLAFDRYRKICHPLAWQLRQYNAMRFCITSVAIGALVASPITILWGKQDYLYVDGVLMLNVSVCEKSGQYADDIYPLLYIACVYILPVGVMMFVVCILNVLTAKTLFCGMDDLRKGLYKDTSNSTLRSVISTVSFGHIFPDNNTTTCDPMDPQGATKTKLNIRCTNIDIWIDTGGHSNASINDTNQETRAIADSRSSTDLSVNISPQSPHSKSTVIGDFANHKESCESSITIVSDSDDTEQSKPRFSLSGESSVTSESTDSLRCLAPRASGQSVAPEHKRKRKTIIMLVLTSVFVVTMLMYVIMISLVADSEGTLKNLSNSEKVYFFFFWRMYFINCLVNPILYGFLDPRFRSGLKGFFTKKKYPTKQKHLFMLKA